MRISDWSSDVCSSDLAGLPSQRRGGRRGSAAAAWGCDARRGRHATGCAAGGYRLYVPDAQEAVMTRRPARPRPRPRIAPAPVPVGLLLAATLGLAGCAGISVL